MIETIIVALLVAGAAAWLFFRLRAVVRGEKTCSGGCAACKARANAARAAGAPDAFACPSSAPGETSPDAPGKAK